MLKFLRSTRFLWPTSVVLALLIGIGIGVISGGAGAGSDDPTPTATAEGPTDTPEPTSTPIPTKTPTPTATPVPPTPKPKPTSTPGPATSFGDGMYRVGIDIAPGTYRNDFSDGCYWERLSGFSGDSDDRITNEFSETLQIVTIRATDAGFSTEDCGTWTLVED